MITIISPAKTLDYYNTIHTNKYSQPELLDDSEILAEALKKFSKNELAKLMDINPDLASLNYERYLQWKKPFTPENAKQALAVFKGQVFIGLEAKSLTNDELLFAQEHLRILSGLYGVLRPLDLIQPYRLEMGTSLKNKRGKNLYDFWGTKITDFINKELSEQKNKVLINLASNEYFKAIKSKKINGEIITPVFKESKGNGFKVVAVYAKTARGLMSRFILRNKVEEPDHLKAFDSNGYLFNQDLSSEKEWVFTR
ncbi:MAG TPA: peroxide stress protein YaaA [Bacteroidales bacterium]|nr:peroxide stress protein YaaA [Bacteroidales bacterium]